ncbi:radical SAM protein [Ignicoccus pacificus DSM 13166]|uniref:Radical SAM protein n=1 Tax=Ignicoccus pacificus DSM 13166 TaxID=940294 RepID=A0A977K9J7_9CREN|nr:radical SAM protein [Ignicoccus pacificus DSM 13166]
MSRGVSVLSPLEFKDTDIYDILEKYLAGELLSVRDIERLLKSHDLWALGKVAKTIKEKHYGKMCTYIKNMILNYTNVCVVRCKFCAFYREPGQGYLLSPRDAYNMIKEVWSRYKIRQVLIQGGVNPEITIDYFEELFHLIKSNLPDVAIHALSPIEIDYLSKKHHMSYREVLERLRDAGLDSLPGGGAELLVERVRKILSPSKIDVETWINIIEIAHRMGIPTSVTMMFGHVETTYERALHLYRLRELQRRAPGSLAFIAWNFEPNKTRLAEEYGIKYPWGGYELLRIIATARIVFDGFIPHIQAGWLTVGKDVAQLALNFGADDWGGTLYNERVIPSTGLKVKFPREDEIKLWIHQAGCEPRERDNWYRVI